MFAFGLISVSFTQIIFFDYYFDAELPVAVFFGFVFICCRVDDLNIPILFYAGL